MYKATGERESKWLSGELQKISQMNLAFVLELEG
jgi:hypothetical protein